MTWQVPWVISGVDEMPIDVARVFAYVATAGRQGVVGVNDLKITQTTTPSANIQTAPGAFVAVSSFSSVTYESYIGRNQGTSVSTAVPATTASARSDLVYAHITDPGQAGQPGTPAAVETRVITGVPSNTTRLQSVAGYENQTGLALARIDRAAGASTVTQAQIVDLRYLVNPRQEQQIFVSPDAVYYAPNERFMLNASSGEAGWGEDRYQPSVAIPSWATRAVVVCTVDGIGILDTSVNITAGIKTGFGTTAIGGWTGIDLDQGTGATRMSVTGIYSGSVTAIAGTTQTLRLIARQNVPLSAPSTRRLKLMNGSQIIHDVRFFEQ